MIIDKLIEARIKTYAFVGPSGTGKSYRAQMVAAERNIKYIIDDGLLINDTKVVAGESAKKAPTKIETIRKALFTDEADALEIKKAFMKYRPDSVLILGTSDNMVEKIRTNLGLNHVIPVPTFEIKKDFSGYILDPLQIFKSKGKNNKPYIAEKSIIRPTFSYLGNYTISDTVFKQIIEYLSEKAEFIYKVSRTRIETTDEGLSVYMEVIVNYGYDIVKGLTDFKKKTKREIENLTAMNVDSIEIIAKGIQLPEEGEK